MRIKNTGKLKIVFIIRYNQFKQEIIVFCLIYAIDNFKNYNYKIMHKKLDIFDIIENDKIKTYS